LGCTGRKKKKGLAGLCLAGGRKRNGRKRGK
jgi:hypothetical protein